MDSDYRPRYPAVLRWLSLLIDVVIVVFGALVIILTFGNAALRGFGASLAWTLEVTAFLMLWVTFLGCAAATARGAHMRVAEVTEVLLPRAVRRYLGPVLGIIIAILLVMLIYFGAVTAIHMWPEQTTVLYWPVGLSYASLPVGIFLTLIFHITNVWLDFASPVTRTSDADAVASERNREGMA